ncbi:class I SAM-dependent methyltransferase [Streptomyces malaysiensis subsp. malaysiensis]|uniref:class I SAM-dependent methyltransferase n=1 Tax=Streptomyces malaysiensis TaxID=92644 RepID=UPI000BFCF886|nr:class I SAM-dependent methyltransferase [Streptomyces malaysiensis]ATL88574.1 hypothetical protein SMALA_8365 [Streptomyces malaysiensis]QDL68157.1 class I SAM-dependent methyltransferase [Streptomyces malaysiensis]
MTDRSPTTGQPAWQSMLQRWAKYAPPGRPSPLDVENFRDRLLLAVEQAADRTGATPERPAQVLVLGATPELRSMLAGLPQVRVTLIDYLLPMLQAMTELLTTPAPDETWVKGDWITAPLPERYFDAVLSDLVLANLPHERQRALVERVHRLLKPGGRWINRIDCVDENSRFLELEELLERYISDEPPTQSDICFLRCAAGLRHWDQETGFQSWGGLGEAMERYREDGRFTHPDPRANRLLEAVWEITEPFDKPYWLREKSALDDMLKHWFSIEHEIRDDAVVPHHERGYYLYDLKPQ